MFYKIYDGIPVERIVDKGFLSPECHEVGISQNSEVLGGA